MDVPEEIEDPTFGEPDSSYASLREEIEARASHHVPQYRIDIARVFEF